METCGGREPVSKSEILNIKDDIYELYNRLSVVAKKTMQESINDGATITFGKNTSDSKEKTGVIIMELRIRKVKMVSIGVNPHNIPNRIRKDMMKAIPKEVIWDLT